MMAPMRKWLHKSLLFAFAASTGLAAVAGMARASSHSDAPLIKLDPQANLTDVYAFIRTVNGQKVLVAEISVRPFSEPGDGVSYEAFSDDALYSIHIADPNTGAKLSVTISGSRRSPPPATTRIWTPSCVMGAARICRTAIPTPAPSSPSEMRTRTSCRPTRSPKPSATAVRRSSTAI